MLGIPEAILDKYDAHLVKRRFMCPGLPNTGNGCAISLISVINLRFQPIRWNGCGVLEKLK